jgi:hypothetical protein
MGSVVASIASIPSWIRAARLGKLAVRCSDREITVENHAEHAHYVFLSDVSVARTDSPEEVYTILDPPPSAQLRLAPGQQAGMPFTIPAPLRRHCGGEAQRRAGDCAVWFRVAVQDVDDPAAPAIDAQGDCSLPANEGTLATATMRVLEPAY